MIIIEVPGKAIGKQRPRATRQGRVYTPSQTINAEAWIKQCAMQAVKDQVDFVPLSGPLEVGLTVVVGVPKSWSRKRASRALEGTDRPVGKPDMDNVVKLHLDALNGIVWKDDAQVVALRASKVYGETPKVILTVEVA